MMRHVLGSALMIAASLTVVSADPAGATVPARFKQRVITSALEAPTAMAVAPDGRLFVAEQGGRLRVITRAGQLRAKPFVSLKVDPTGERGLLGVAFHPRFTKNHYVYVYWTVPGTPAHNRITRFTANGNVARAGSARRILDLDPLSAATNHNGGAIHFSPGGKLFVGVGENANSANSQTLSNRLGKVLRLNANGSIPASNPFYKTATGKNRAIYALGLRNPYTLAFQRTTGQLFINDVGQDSWEEINRGRRGADYGWPRCEGSTGCPSGTKLPYYRYAHSGATPSGCAITGGAFYNPVKRQFPKGYVGDYFFADYCGGWIYRVETKGAKKVHRFATNLGAPVDLALDRNGALLYLSHEGTVGRISYVPAR